MKNNIINIAGAVIILSFIAWAGYAAGYSNAEIERAEVRHHTMRGYDCYARRYAGYDRRERTP